MDGMALAEYILEKAAALGAGLAECTVSRELLTELGSEAGKIQLARSVASDEIALKVIVDGKKGSVRLNQKDEASLHLAIESALKSAAEAAADEAEGISDEKENGVFATGTLEPDLDRLYTLLSNLIADTATAFPLVKYESAEVKHTRSSKFYANTNGVRHQAEEGYNTISTMFSGNRDGKASSFNYFGQLIPDGCTNLLDLDNVRRLLGDAEKQIDTESIGDGAITDVLFSPDCFVNVLFFVEGTMLADMALISGTSPWQNKLGEAVAATTLVWRSAPLDDRFVVNDHVTADGFLSKDHTLIEHGVLKNFSLSRYGAKKSGQARSGNQSSMYVVEPGDKTVAEIIGGIKRGLLVNRFSGGNPAPNGDFSGVAKNAFLIEDGRITKAVTETMIAGNLCDVLLNIKALSSEQLGDGMRLVPWAHVTGISVTG